MNGWIRRLALLVFAVGVVAFRDAIMDDTFIHLQYARNLRQAGELAFNPGEPSLGATSPLWLLLLAATGAGEMAARLLSVALGALGIFVFASLARRTLGANSWAWAATVAWAGNLWLVRHAPNGMETALAVLLVLVALELRARGGKHAGRDALFGLALAGAFLTRPEVALLAAITLVHDAASRTRRDRLAAWIPAFVLPCAAWFVFAHHATGQLLPDTGSAKSGGLLLAPAVWLRVLQREAAMLGAAHVIDVIGLVAGFVFALRLDGRRTFDRCLRHPLTPYGVFAVGLVLAYAAFDVQVQPRYLLIATPCVVLAGFAAWGALLGESRFAALVCAASLAVGGIVGAKRVYGPTRDFAAGVEHVLKPMAREVASRHVPGARVAAPDIGIMGYFGGLPVLDLGGLVEPRIQGIVAEHGYDTMLERGLFLDVAAVEYVLDRSPESERFAGHVTRGLRWRPLRTAAMRGLGISRPQTYFYTLYALEPPSAFGFLEATWPELAVR